MDIQEPVDKSIEAVHDFLDAYCKGDFDESRRRCRVKSNRAMASGALAALCWIMGHGWRPDFREWLDREMEDVKDSGYVLPHDAAEAEALRTNKEIMARISVTFHSRVKSGKMQIGTALKKASEAAKQAYDMLVPIRKGACKACGSFHDEKIPHDHTSPYLRLYCIACSGFEPSWRTVFEHCDERLQGRLAAHLLRHEVELTDPVHSLSEVAVAEYINIINEWAKQPDGKR